MLRTTGGSEAAPTGSSCCVGDAEAFLYGWYGDDVFKACSEKNEVECDTESAYCDWVEDCDSSYSYSFAERGCCVGDAEAMENGWYGDDVFDACSEKLTEEACEPDLAYCDWIDDCDSSASSYSYYGWSYSYASDESNDGETSDTKRERSRGFERDYDFDYPAREHPDDVACVAPKTATTECMRSYNCTGDDDTPYDDTYDDLGHVDDYDGMVSACSAAQNSAAFRKDCRSQLRGCGECAYEYYAYVECVYEFYAEQSFGGHCEFACDGIYDVGGAARATARAWVTAALLALAICQLAP